MHITDIINAAEHTANYWLKEGKIELYDGFKIFAHYLRSQHVIEINRKTKKEENEIKGMINPYYSSFPIDKSIYNLFPNI